MTHKYCKPAAFRRDNWGEQCLTRMTQKWREYLQRFSPVNNLILSVCIHLVIYLLLVATVGYCLWKLHQETLHRLFLSFSWAWPCPDGKGGDLSSKLGRAAFSFEVSLRTSMFWWGRKSQIIVVLISFPLLLLFSFSLDHSNPVFPSFIYIFSTSYISLLEMSKVPGFVTSIFLSCVLSFFASFL